jgi:hypothetical protein
MHAIFRLDLLAQPVTSVAEFGRVLRDDIIPLLEEYCYDDFATLKEILGNGLVDHSRPAWMRPVDHDLQIEGLRKAGLTE